MTRHDLITLCIEYGAKLVGLPSGVTGKQLLWAIAGNESSFGANVIPRHEPSYDVEGSVYLRSQLQRDLVKKYGSPAACSYGPWQILYANCYQLTSPMVLLNNPAACAQCTIEQMNKFLKLHKPDSLAEIGMLWNAGHIVIPPTPVSPGVQRYIEELQKNYQEPMQ